MAEKKQQRFAVRVTSHGTGEQWAIHDTKAVCEKERDRILKEWGPGSCTVDGPIPITEE